MIYYPKLSKTSLFVIDNASFHKHESIKNLLEQQGHKLLFLSPCSWVQSNWEKISSGKATKTLSSM